MAKKQNYVNNKDLLKSLIEYREACKEAEDSGEEIPRVPDYIGECIFMIANRLATKPNFSGYSYKDDMISDGIENCLQYIQNFDPEKSNNPFAYFTQIIWFAFLRRIQKEKKQLYIRYKSSQKMMSDVQMIEGSENIEFMQETPEYINDFIKEFEGKLTAKKRGDDE